MQYIDVPKSNYESMQAPIRRRSSRKSSLPPDFVLAARDGATVHVAQHGGHLCRWRTSDGVERLYLSPLPRQPGEPIRGGIPVVFPQFANRGPLPMHGYR